MEIQLSKCKLRPWRIEDADSLVSNANNQNIAKNLRDIFPYPYTFNDARFFIIHIANSKKKLTLAIEVEGKAVGSVGIHPQNDVYRKSGELGYWLGETYWGRGIVSEATNAIVHNAFENLDLNRIYACVFVQNAASMRVLEKCGFVREAIHQKAVIKNGVIMDEYIYVCFRD